MKAIVLHDYGPPSALKYEDFPDPKPASGEILIEVYAIGVNPIDWKIRSGAMKQAFPTPFPAILGYDVAGIVKQCGDGVEGFAPGDHVFGRLSGAYAQLAVGKAAEMAKVPEGVDLTTAAAIPVVATTADQLIREAAGTQSGQTILLTGALGSVGRLALFCALELGANVIAGVRKKQIDEALALGATAAIDISDDDALARLGTIDAVADTIGGDLAPKLLAHVKTGGNYGSIVGPPKDAALHPTVHVNAMGSHADANAIVHYAEAIRDGKVKLPIDLILPLEKASEAHTKGEKGGIGKIVLTTQADS
ncbi:zinc-binding dehydrogenase [Granulicella sp. 5B5]|uniref:NADP-dependent oxidoreductase n=1 Tax=Granulicella sp. 5B5 TaxID=1617967 RepID=UPI0015F4C2EE|nr:NADP-dependent oxidoreductase [Granulicella sp. 5B5]QMV18790.1 zinc-binding dehydrogenase [Granulicella sp. 5B5]